MAVNWDLVRAPDIGGNFMRGYQGGQQIQRDRKRQTTLERLAAMNLTDPRDLEQAGIELMAAGDAQTGAALTGLATSREDRSLRREQRAEDVAHRDRSFAADQDYRTQSLGVQRAGQNKEPDTIRTLRAMGIDPRSPEARGYVKQPGNTSFGDTADLRKEIRTLPSYKAMATVEPMYESMVTAAQRDNRASDVSLVFGLMKTLDPTSVVRESEVSMAENIATLPAQYRAQVQSFLTGKGRLAPEARQAILAEAKGALDSYSTAYERDVAQYRNIVGSAGLREDLVIPSFGTPQRAGAAPQMPQFNPADVAAEARRRGLIK